MQSWSLLAVRKKWSGCVEWMCGEYRLPRVCSYRYLGIDLTCNGAWDVHVNNVIDSGRTKFVECCYLLQLDLV